MRRCTECWRSWKHGLKDTPQYLKNHACSSRPQAQRLFLGWVRGWVAAQEKTACFSRPGGTVRSRLWVREGSAEVKPTQDRVHLSSVFLPLPLLMKICVDVRIRLCGRGAIGIFTPSITAKPMGLASIALRIRS
jgi:hypothetical protein